MGVLPLCAELFCLTILSWPQKNVNVDDQLGDSYLSQLVWRPSSILQLKGLFFAGVFMCMGNGVFGQNCAPSYTRRQSGSVCALLAPNVPLFVRLASAKPGTLVCLGSTPPPPPRA